jgi:hypothetical protein
MAKDQAITRNLADAQTAHAYRKLAAERQGDSVLYTLYTEDYPNLIELVSRYFPGATLYYAIGWWQGGIESSRVIEIVGKHDDLQRIVHLAGDIRHVNNQSSVLVTWAPVNSLLVSEP